MKAHFLTAYSSFGMQVMSLAAQVFVIGKAFEDD